MVSSETREIRRLEPQSRWDKEAVNSVIGVPWRVDRSEVRGDSNPIPPVPFEGARVQRERVTNQDIDECRATIGCPGCNAIKGKKRAQATPRSLQKANRRMSQNNATRSRKLGSKKCSGRHCAGQGGAERRAEEEEERKRHSRSARIRTSSIRSVRTERKLRLNQTRIRRGDCSEDDESRMQVEDLSEMGFW